MILALFISLASLNLNKEFINVTSDTNGENGLVVINWLNVGSLRMKLGKYTTGYLYKSNFDFQNIKNEFYTHHPVFYLFPTYILYRIFGISEVTTRGGILSMMIISIVFFYFALKKIFSNHFYPFLILLIFVILPGTVYYGTTFELAIFSLPMALITYSLFVLYYFTKKNIYFYFLLGSVFLGGLMGWFYFFMPASIWLYLLIDKNVNFAKERKKLLIVLPLISIFAFCFNLLHVYILKGQEGFIDLKGSFLARSQRIPLSSWLPVIHSRMQINFNDLFLWLSILGIFIYFSKYFKLYKILLPLLLMPFLNALVFYQWTTHPFGVVFFLPTVAILSFFSIKFILENFKFYGFIFLIAVLIFGFYLSYKKLDFLINKFLILGKEDIELLKSLKNQINDNEICLGHNQMGLYYGGIAMWYLRKNIYFSPNCLEDENKLKNLKGAIIFHPQLGQFYQEEANRFIQKGFKPIGCANLWCLLSK